MISLPDYLSELAANFYPELEQDAAINFYATYYPLINFGDFPTVTADVRSAPLNRMAGEILGLKFLPPKPTFKPTAPPVTNAPHVCIAVQTSNARKCWFALLYKLPRQLRAGIIRTVGKLLSII